MGASAIFDGEGARNRTIHFRLKKLDTPGYLMRTLSLSGRKLGVFAGDPDPRKASRFASQKMSEFDKVAPSYSPHVKQRFVFPFQVLSAAPESITFYRLPVGVIDDGSVSIKKKAVGNHGGDRYYFYVYRMMLEILKLYNHSFLPGDCRPDSLEQLPAASWKGDPLKLSDHLTRIGGLMAAIIHKHIRAQQQGTFELLYRVTEKNGRIIVIEGSASPDVKVYGGFRITGFRREVTVDRSDGLILEDAIFVEIRNRKGRGGIGEARLVRLD